VLVSTENQPRRLRHHVAHVVMPSRRKHRDLLDESLSPRGIPGDIPISSLPFGSRSEHAREWSSLSLRVSRLCYYTENIGGIHQTPDGMNKGSFSYYQR